MTEPRAGSRKASVYQRFKEQGIEAATQLAVSLGLKAGTVKSWAGDWSRGEDKAPKSAKSKTAKITPARDNRVRWTADHELQGTVVSKGEQVSTVRWDDGRERHVPNNQLEPLEGPRPAKDPIKGTENDFSQQTLEQWERKVFLNANLFTVYRKLQRVKTKDKVHVEAATQGYKDFAKAALEAAKHQDALLYAVTESGRSCCLTRKRWPEFLQLWKEKHNLQ